MTEEEKHYSGTAPKIQVCMPMKLDNIKVLDSNTVLQNLICSTSYVENNQRRLCFVYEDYQEIQFSPSAWTFACQHVSAIKQKLI